MTSTTYASREEWLLARRSLVTASDVAAILGVDPHRDALSVYADKIGASEQEDSLVMRRGRRMEAAIAEEAAEVLGVELQDPRMTIFRHAKYEWIGATIDRFYCKWLPPEPGACNMIPVQIKLGLGSYADWKDEVPRHYQVQVLTEGAVMAAPFGTIAGLIGPGPLHVADVQYDEELFELIVPRLREFLDRVERRDPPEPTSGLALEPLKRIWPGADGRTVDLKGEQYVKAADEWTYEKSEAKRFAEDADMSQALLRRYMGSAQWGRLDDGSLLERQKTKSRDVLKRIWTKRSRA